jgi:cysteine desulfurase
MSRVYLDHAATTPLRQEAREAMRRGFEIWANPSSPHAEGRAARSALEDARARVKAALGWDGEVIFTSGASEAAQIAMRWTQADNRYVSATEHDSVLSLRDDWTDDITVHSDGSMDKKLSGLALTDRRKLLAVQHVNSETGNRQDIAGIASCVAGTNTALLVDCAQSAGKFSLPDADLAILSAHKFGGPIGVGALLVKDFAMLHPMGGQERGYRRGTENLPGVVGMAAALDACGDPYLDPDILEPLDALAEQCRALGGAWLSDRLADPTPYIRAIAMPGLSGSAQLMRFDLAGISVSQGSACSSGSLHSSHVLKAMGVPDEEAARTIRISFGWTTTRSEIERFCEAWLAMAREGAERAA